MVVIVFYHINAKKFLKKLPCGFIVFLRNNLGIQNYFTKYLKELCRGCFL